MAIDPPGVELLEGRRDLAALRNLRVAPAARGAALRAAEAWVEAQDVNAPPAYGAATGPFGTSGPAWL